MITDDIFILSIPILIISKSKHTLKNKKIRKTHFYYIFCSGYCRTNFGVFKCILKVLNIYKLVDNHLLKRIFTPQL